MSGQGFQLGQHGGFVPIQDTAIQANASEVIPAGRAIAAIEAMAQAPVEITLATKEPRATTKNVAALKPRDVVKLARARTREIKRELKRHVALKKELTQLERLIAAADGKTLAPVRAIDSARRSAV